MILPLVYYGDPRLRTHCEPLEVITEEIHRLAQDMIETMDKHNGVGLAAPQVGRLIRLFVLRNYEETEMGHIRLTTPQVYINPKISHPSEITETEEEACISIPRVRLPVKRPLKITVEARNLQGEVFVEHLEGYKARVVMHENDHLNGVLIMDRTDPALKKQIEPLLRKLRKSLENRME